MHFLPDDWPFLPFRGAIGASTNPYQNELRERIERLRRARDALRAQRPLIGPDVTAIEVAEILDVELSRLLNRLSEWS